MATATSSAESKKSDKKKEETEKLMDAMTDASKEMNKLFRAFLFAGLETIALNTDLARKFVDKLYEENNREDLEVGDRIMNLPRDMAEAFIYTLKQSNEMQGKVIDKFYEKYKED